MKWVFTKDQLPDKQGEYLVAWLPMKKKLRDRRKGKCFLEICEFEPDGNGWITNESQMTAYGGAEIMAWAVLPECVVEE